MKKLMIHVLAILLTMIASCTPDQSKLDLDMEIKKTEIKLTKLKELTDLYALRDLKESRCRKTKHLIGEPNWCCNDNSEPNLVDIEKSIDTLQKELGLTAHIKTVHAAGFEAKSRLLYGDEH